MSRLIESIKLLDGKFHNLFYHEQRMKIALWELFGIDRPADLTSYLMSHDYPRKGLYKCRVLYDEARWNVMFTAYEPRTIRRVKVVEDEEISYEHKFEDRSGIDRLFNKRGACDDVLIVRKGKVTDCSFSNVAFRKGAAWFTPAVPLLNGTTRQRLIHERKILPREILKEEISSFETFRLMNAMLEFDSPEIEVSDIVF